MLAISGRVSRVRAAFSLPDNPCSLGRDYLCHGAENNVGRDGLADDSDRAHIPCLDIF